MPDSPAGPRRRTRRLTRWLIAPLAVATAVTAVQVVHSSGPGPLRTAAAGAAPTVVLYSETAYGRRHQIIGLQGPAARPTGGTVRVCAADVDGPGTSRCLRATFSMVHATGRLAVHMIDSGTVAGRRLAVGHDIVFRSRPVTLDPPAAIGHTIQEEVLIAGTNIGFQRGQRLFNGRAVSYYRIWMPADVSSPSAPARTFEVLAGTPRWADASAIAGHLRAARTQQLALRRNNASFWGTVAVTAFVAVLAGVFTGPAAAAAAGLTGAITSRFFSGPAQDNERAFTAELARAADQFESTFGTNIAGDWV